MKKVLFAAALLFGGATLVNAQQQDQPVSPTQTQAQTTDQDQDRQEISPSELPDAVSAKLESADYSGWTVEHCYKKMDDSNNEVYIIEMKQGEESKKVKFDRDGNKLEGEDEAAGQEAQPEAQPQEETQPGQQ